MKHRIFISYSHRDEAWKDRLVAHFRVVARRGEIDAWDDRRIQAGADWKTQIETAIARADTAILLISADFMSSAFIQDEEVVRILKRRAAGSLRVIPVIVRPCAWTAVEWLGDLQARPRDGRPLSSAEDHEAEADLAALALDVFPPPSWLPAIVDRRWATLALTLLPAVLVGTLILAAASIKVATPLQLDIVARAVSFTVGGEESSQLLDNSTAFSRLVVEQCETVTFPAISIGKGDGELAPPPRVVTFRCDTRVPGAKVVVRARRPEQAETMSPRPVGTLGRIVAEPGDRVSLAMTNAAPPEIWLEVSREASFDFSMERETPFEIVTEFAEAEGLPFAGQPPDIGIYPASLPASSTVRLATAQGRRGLSVVVEPARAADVEGLFRADVDIPIESLSLFERGDEDRLVSTAIAGTLTYPGRQSIDGVRIRAGQNVQLRDLTGFRLRQLRADPQNAGVWFRFQGNAVGVNVGSEDRRLTLLDRMFDRNTKIAGIVVAVALQWVWMRRRPRLSRQRAVPA